LVGEFINSTKIIIVIVFVKILIIEDSEPKLSAVLDCIRRADVLGDVQVHSERSFLSGVRSLENTAYDLLVLDLVLPFRDGEVASREAGNNILQEILNGGKCFRPSHIVCLTAFEDVSLQIGNALKSSLLHVVVYNDLDLSWRSTLQAKLLYVASRLNDVDRVPESFKIDLLIVTSSPSAELSEVVKLPGGFNCEYHQIDGLYYYSASWVGVNDRKISVVACSAPYMGMTAACVTACKAVERWRPKFLAMAGIAAGAKRGEQNFGDVLVAETAYDYGSGKIVEKEGANVLIPSPKQLHIDRDLHAVLQRWEREQCFVNRIKEAWPGESRSVPRITLGVLATGAAVVQSSDLVEDIRLKSRKVVGLEMEAYGIFQVAALARRPRPRVLVAKSVSDFADADKNDDWHQYAAFTSARFVYEFFTNAEELDIGVGCHDKGCF
jgi:nucleoside phosphorylase